MYDNFFGDRKQISGSLGRGLGIRKGGITKEHKEMLGNDGYVHCLGCGDGFIGVYVCQIVSVLYTSNMCINCTLFL